MIRLPWRKSRTTARSLGWGLIGVRVDKTRQQDEQLRGGMSGYLLPFEIVSVHLLVVLIGAAYLARTRRKVALRGRRQAVRRQAVMNLLTEPVGVSPLPGRGRRSVRLRRGLHGHQAERAGRADGHRTGAQRREHQLRRLWQPVPAAADPWGWTAN